MQVVCNSRTPLFSVLLRLMYCHLLCVGPLSQHKIGNLNASNCTELVEESDGMVVNFVSQSVLV